MRGVNPVAKLGAAAFISICLVLSIDWVSAGIALALELLGVAALRVPPGMFWRRTWPVWLAAVLTAFTILLYGQPMGRVYLRFLFIDVTDGSIALAIATFLRVLAIALPAVLMFASIDPTELADGLAQQLHLAARFVIGALAGLRLISLFGEDWRSLQLARRARGIADSGHLARLAGQAFALLVLSVRRGSALATAMEARGFGAPGTRTWARESVWRARDWVVLAGGLTIGGIAIAASVTTGHWNFIVG
jgi:energy-coupling factor transport system permease protein